MKKNQNSTPMIATFNTGVHDPSTDESQVSNNSRKSAAIRIRMKMTPKAAIVFDAS